jgi:hypothetical protein
MGGNVALYDSVNPISASVWQRLKKNFRRSDFVHDHTTTTRIMYGWFCVARKFKPYTVDSRDLVQSQEAGLIMNKLSNSTLKQVIRPHLAPPIATRISGYLKGELIRLLDVPIRLCDVGGGSGPGNGKIYQHYHSGHIESVTMIDPDGTVAYGKGFHTSVTIHSVPWCREITPPCGVITSFFSLTAPGWTRELRQDFINYIIGYGGSFLVIVPRMHSGCDEFSDGSTISSKYFDTYAEMVVGDKTFNDEYTDLTPLFDFYLDPSQIMSNSKAMKYYDVTVDDLLIFSKYFQIFAHYA